MKYYFPFILIAVFTALILIIFEFCDKDEFEVYEKINFDHIESKDKPVLTIEIAQKLAELPLTCIKKDFPNKPSHVYGSEADFVPHNIKTPIFSGCFDWHSSVHMHWTLIRLIRLFPQLSKKTEIITLLDEQFTSQNIEKEIAFYNEEYNKTFERTYGWAWFLRLQSELILLNDENGKKWKDVLAPLAKIIRDRTIEYFMKLPGPVRPGTHSNTAFSMDHILNYSKTANDSELERVIKTRAIDFFHKDIKCPVSYEPSGIDFVSPCLSEAFLMAQVLDKDEFSKWINNFFGNVDNQIFSSVLNPPEITDHTDYVIGHLVGLNFQRAWSYFGIAEVLPQQDYRKDIFNKVAILHLYAGLEGMDKTGYGGEHWLASFALYAFSFNK